MRVSATVGRDTDRDWIIRMKAASTDTGLEAAKAAKESPPDGYRLDSATVSRRKSGSEVRLKVVIHLFDKRLEALTRSQAIAFGDGLFAIANPEVAA